MTNEYVPAMWNYGPRDGERREQFDAIDSKGRRVGARVSTCTIEIVARTDGLPYGSVAKPENFGTWYSYRASATRDGISFGAIQPDHKFRTVAERDAAIEKYFAAARKRAAKAAART